MALELIEGRRLDEHCIDGALPGPQRLRLFLDVCDAVQYAHGRGVLHRDLKPSNVMVDADGSAKLLDFGIAALIGDDPVAPRAFTPGYASPEQLAGEPQTVASDIYQLGVLLGALMVPDRASSGSAVRLDGDLAAITGPGH
ncbi:MAG: protein kinase [Rhodanobacteraceae bacterium]|nr:protein kinase [Rhodanobacteraceae bacterium]